jgi:hypothetical protein
MPVENKVRITFGVLNKLVIVGDVKAGGKF